MIRRTRALVYKMGFRPKQGNPLHSPSLAYLYAFKDKPLKLKGVDFDGDTIMDVGSMKPISIFGPDQMVSRHPDIPDQVKWMAYNHGDIEPFESAYSELWEKANDAGLPYSAVAFAAIDKVAEMTTPKRSYIVTPRKHGRSKAMLEEIKHNLRYGKGTVAYVGPGMTITERPNPWPVGTDAWHLWNLRGNTWGHVETLTNGPQGVEGVFRVYTPSQFLWSRLEAAKGVRTVLQDQIHDESHVSIIDQWLPRELM